MCLWLSQELSPARLWAKNFHLQDADAVYVFHCPLVACPPEQEAVAGPVAGVCATGVREAGATGNEEKSSKHQSRPYFLGIVRLTINTKPRNGGKTLL